MPYSRASRNAPLVAFFLDPLASRRFRPPPGGLPVAFRPINSEVVTGASTQPIAHPIQCRAPLRANTGQLWLLASGRLHRGHVRTVRRISGPDLIDTVADLLGRFLNQFLDSWWPTGLISPGNAFEDFDTLDFQC
jgi:hypothetical protein